MTPDNESLVPPGTWVIIPVYNERRVIGSVLDEVRSAFDCVVCVDDGSSDGTAEVLAQTPAHVLRHPFNLGQGASLQTGLDYALRNPASRFFITFDADGQHRVEDALAVLSVLRQQDVDIVFGSRFLDDRTELPATKRLILKAAVRYTKATSGMRLTDAHNGLRAFNRQVAEAMHLQQGGMGHASEILEAVARANFRYAEVPVRILYTDYSRTKGQPLLNSINILFDLWFR